MTTYFDMAQDFFAQNPNLLVGMEAMTGDQLAYLLARDIATEGKNKLGSVAASGVKELLRPEVAALFEDSWVSHAFIGGNFVKLRRDLIRDGLERAIESYVALHPGLDAVRVAKVRGLLLKNSVFGASKKTSGSISGQVDYLMDRFVQMLTVGNLDPDAELKVTLGHLSSNFEELRSAKANEESTAVETAYKGVKSSLRLAATGADLEDYSLATVDRDVHKRSLLYWVDPNKLAEQYPHPKIETAEGLEAFSRKVASRINYPFGLVESSSRSTMIAAVFLAYATLSSAEIKTRGNQAASGSEISGRLFEEVLHALKMHMQKSSVHSGVQGFDIVSVAAVALTKLEEKNSGTEESVEWSAGVLSALLRGDNVGGAVIEDLEEVVRQIELALPLPELHGESGRLPWYSTEKPIGTYGSWLLNMLSVEARKLHGGGLSEEDEDQDSEVGLSSLDYLMASTQLHALLLDSPLECLHQFRNRLVNSETGNISHVTYNSVQEINAALKNFKPKQLNVKLGMLRKKRNKLYAELAKEGTLRARGISQKYAHSDDPQLNYIIDIAVEENREMVHALHAGELALGQEEVVALRLRHAKTEGVSHLQLIDGANLVEVLQRSLENNRKYFGNESPTALEEDSPTWRQLLGSEHVSLMLKNLVNGDDKQIFIPRSEAAYTYWNDFSERSGDGPIVVAEQRLETIAKNDMSLSDMQRVRDSSQGHVLSGVYLREISMWLQAFLTYSSKLTERKTEKTLLAQLEKYFDRNDAVNDEKIKDAVLCLATCLLMDAFLPGRDTL